MNLFSEITNFLNLILRQQMAEIYTVMVEEFGGEDAFIIAQADQTVAKLNSTVICQMFGR